MKNNTDKCFRLITSRNTTVMEFSSIELMEKYMKNHANQAFITSLTKVEVTTIQHVKVLK